jgi:hypothetical protein
LKQTVSNAFEFCLSTLCFLLLLLHASVFLNPINFDIAWDVVLVERVNPMDVKVMAAAAPVAVTG